MASAVILTADLRRILRQLPDDLTTEIKKEMKEAGDVLEAEILARVPVDSGDLAHSLGRKDQPSRLRVELGFARKFGKKKWRLAGWRAHFIEYGTRGYTPKPQRGRRGRGFGSVAVPPLPPRPFFASAARAAIPQFEHRVDSAVARLLRRAGR